MKWQAKITEVGSEVIDLMEESHMFDLVAEGKWEDLRDYTVYFKGDFPDQPIKEDDIISIGSTELVVVAMGEHFNDHLRDHGVCTVEISTGIVPGSPCSVILDGIYEDYGFLKKGADIYVD
jgi:sorbitol-specific phosphotransferase system component IIA